MTARQIMARTLSEVSGKAESDVLAILGALPHQPPGLDREYSSSEAERLLAAFREEAPGILDWLVQGARQARLGFRSARRQSAGGGAERRQGGFDR